MVEAEFTRQLIAFQSDLFRLAYSWARDRAAAQDLRQDTNVLALVYRDRFCNDSRSMRPNALHYWLSTICRYRFLSIRRKDSNPNVQFVELTGTELDLHHSPNDPEQGLIVEQSIANLGKLVPNQREVVVALGLGYSYLEVAEQQGCPEGTVKSRATRGRMRLAELCA